MPPDLDRDVRTGEQQRPVPNAAGIATAIRRLANIIASSEQPHDDRVGIELFVTQVV